MEKQCPRCGRFESREYAGKPLAFVGFFCIDCFSEKHDFYALPAGLKLWRCSRCGKARFPEGWAPYTDELLVKWVVAKLKPKYDLKAFAGTVRPAKNALVVSLKLSFTIQGETVPKEAVVHVTLDSNACVNCSRKSGGYHEAVIQLRGEDLEKLHRKAEKLVKDIQRDSYVVEVKVLPEGLDILVGDKKTAMQAVAKLDRDFTISRTLVGQKQGKRLFRSTICVRF